MMFASVRFLLFALNALAILQAAPPRLGIKPLDGIQTQDSQPPQTGEEDSAPDPGLDGPEALPNFHVVEPNQIYRSGQPNREGFAQLARGDLPGLTVPDSGQSVIKTVLDLRNINGPEAPIIQQEQQLVESLGMQSIVVPLIESQTPTFQSVDQALAVLTDPAKYPILVHCRAGKDRTGIVVAAYRVVIDKMDVDQAVTEAQSFGCCAPYMIDLKTFLQNYVQYRAQKEAGQSSSPKSMRD